MKEFFGKTKSGEDVYRITLGDIRKDHVCLINYGATIQSIVIDGTDVCLGYDNLASYENNGGCLGGLIGRCANRISGASFMLDGKEVNLSPNKVTFHQHGGVVGFHKKVWAFNEEENSVEFTLVSQDGDEGYPGNLTAKVKYTFKDGVLSLDYDACSDKKTMVNLTNHVYFNLNGEGDVLKDRLEIKSDRVAWSDTSGVPNGELVDVKDTPFDFREEKSIDWAWTSDYPLFASKKGYDINYYTPNGGKLSHVATCKGAKTGIEMQVWSDMDDVVVYNSTSLPEFDGKYGQKYGKYKGICFECQYMTNAVNLKGFRKPLFDVNEHFKQHTEYRFKA